MRAAALLLLVLTAACCPVPTAGGGEAAFAATVEAVTVETATVEEVEGGSVDPGPVSSELLVARLTGGKRVSLALPARTEAPEVGALIWVEGTVSGETVQVRLLRVIEQVASGAV